MANKKELMEQAHYYLETRGVEKTLEILVDALSLIGDNYQQLEIEKKFFENLSSELMTEKQNQMRADKGVYYLVDGKLTKEKPTKKSENEEPIDYNFPDVDFDKWNRCDGCICQQCEKLSCVGCRFEAERCEECTVLEEEDE